LSAHRCWHSSEVVSIAAVRSAEDKRTPVITSSYLTTTRHHSAGNFATFSATKILINEIMGGITGSKLPFRIIFRA